MQNPATTFLLMFASTWIAACFLTQKSQGSDAGADGSAATPSDGRGAEGRDSGASDCATDPITKVTLCSAVAQCPSLVINHDAFPNCGYRLRGFTFDIQCWCNGYVCPLGSPTTCSEVEQLMQSQTEPLVCAQANEGRCTQPQGDTSGGTTGQPSVPNSCDRECMKQCGFTPGCQELCNCSKR
jgi:hypothetical protein